MLTKFQALLLVNKLMTAKLLQLAFRLRIPLLKPTSHWNLGPSSLSKMLLWVVLVSYINQCKQATMTQQIAAREREKILFIDRYRYTFLLICSSLFPEGFCNDYNLDNMIFFYIWHFLHYIVFAMWPIPNDALINRCLQLINWE